MGRTYVLSIKVSYAVAVPEITRIGECINTVRKRSVFVDNR